MSIKKLAENNYYRFCCFNGSEYIATEYALIIILKLIKEFKVRSVLELGLGIGCISDTVLKYSLSNESIRYVGTEANDFCKEALKVNVDHYEKLEKYEYLSDIRNGKKFDLIIIDGQDKNLADIPSLCNEKAIIFIEGDRSAQTSQISSLFPKSKLVHIISLKKHKDYANGNPNFFVGGGKVIFTNPSLSMKVFWFREKVKTFIKRKLRKF